jgi:hypothetical protein
MRLRTLLLPVLAVLALELAPACSNESEGQPCNQLAGNSGNDDCQSPLVCTVVPAGTRCCPTDRSQATTVECSVSAGKPPGDSAPPPETEGGAEASVAEAAADAPSDAADAADALSDAADAAHPTDASEASATTGTPDSAAPVDASGAGEAGDARPE